MFLLRLSPIILGWDVELEGKLVWLPESMRGNPRKKRVLSWFMGNKLVLGRSAYCGEDTYQANMLM